MYFSTKMATFRDARDALMLANDMTLIDDEELLLLYDLNSSKNLDLPYWRYDKFDLDTLTDAECRAISVSQTRHLHSPRSVKSP